MAFSLNLTTITIQSECVLFMINEISVKLINIDRMYFHSNQGCCIKTKPIHFETF